MRWPYVRATRLGQAEQRVRELEGVIRRAAKGCRAWAETETYGPRRLRSLWIRPLLEYADELEETKQ